jgi:carbon monoxide dehydrogenase subunit G
MEIGGEYKFEVPQQVLWEVLQDPRALSLIIPLAMDMKQVGENQYTGALFFKVGSVAGLFRGKIELYNLQAPTSYEIKVHGSSPTGQVDIVGGLRLESNGDETTMFYHGKINFGGRIVSVGSRLIELAVRTIIQSSLETLNRYMKLKYKTPKQ